MADPAGELHPGARLVLAVRAEEPGAWEALVATYGRLALTVPREMGLDDDDCDEVFQRTWISLWRQIPLLRQPAGVGAWIATTARRHAGELIRQRRRLREREERGSRPETVDAPGPLRSVEDLELRQLVEAGVAELSDRCRELLARLDLAPDPPSYDELSQELGIPRGTIGPTRMRCLARLAERLERWGVQ